MTVMARKSTEELKAHHASLMARIWQGEVKVRIAFTIDNGGRMGTWFPEYGCGHGAKMAGDCEASARVMVCDLDPSTLNEATQEYKPDQIVLAMVGPKGGPKRVATFLVEYGMGEETADLEGRAEEARPYFKPGEVCEIRRVAAPTDYVTKHARPYKD